MAKIRITICLVFGVFFGSLAVGWSADFQAGIDAYQLGNYRAAMQEWRALAEQGDPAAQVRVGTLYLNGQGIPRDANAAAIWYRLAAEQGYAEAQFNLGLMYSGRNDVPRVWRVRHQEHKEAVKWYRLAAEQGYAEAQFNLGLMYGKGEGVVQNLVYAFMWMSVSINTGYQHAINGRDRAAKAMTQSQFEKAQYLARECVRKEYKGC